MNQAAHGNNSDDVVGKKLLVLARLFTSSPSPEWATWLRAPLDSAARVGDFALVTAILQAGADAGSAGKSIVGAHNNSSSSCDRRKKSNNNLIAAAAFGGSPRVVSALVAAGSRGDINMADASTGGHPLHIAASRGHRTVVQLLLRLGAEVNARVVCCPGDSTDRHQGPNKHNVDGGYRSSAASLRQGMTPLHFAAIQGHWEIMVDLIMHGADMEAKHSASQESPMHLAARRGHHTAVSALLAAGAQTTVLSRRNLFPMDLAACHGHSRTVREFLDCGIDPNTKNPLGYTALHQAAYHNEAETLEMLVDAGGNLNAVTKKGHTPLHAAAFSSTSSVRSGGKVSNDARRASSAVRTIGKYSAFNIDATDASGATPLQTACNHLRERAVEELLGMGADPSLVRFSSSANEATIMLAAKNKNNNNSSNNPAGVARVRAMLTTARADAAWRRRGWLVLLRTRALAFAQQTHQVNYNPVPPSAGAGMPGNLVGKRARNTMAVGSGYRMRGDGGGGEFPCGKRGVVGGRYPCDNGRSSSGHRGRGSGGVFTASNTGNEWGEVFAAEGIRGGGDGRGELLRTTVRRTTLLRDVTVFRKIVAFL